jgi:hypothetical protein
MPLCALNEYTLFIKNKKTTGHPIILHMMLFLGGLAEGKKEGKKRIFLTIQLVPIVQCRN